MIKNILLFLILYGLLSCSTEKENPDSVWKKSRFDLESVNKLFKYINDSNICSKEFSYGNGLHVEFWFEKSQIHGLKITWLCCDLFEYDLGSFRALDYVSIQGDELREVQVFDNPNILDFHIDHCHFIKIPQINGLENLFSFSMSYNYLKGSIYLNNQLPIKVQSVDLSCNLINELKIDKRYSKIEKLVLSNNDIRNLDSSIYSLPNLEYLYLGGNDSLGSINIERFRTLRVLELPLNYCLTRLEKEHILGNDIIVNLK